jgi:hypothetical protein
MGKVPSATNRGQYVGVAPPPGRDDRPGTLPASGPSPLIRAEAWQPSHTRVCLIREHWHRMRLAVAYWERQGRQDQADRCRRAMAWAEEQLGLR